MKYYKFLITLILIVSFLACTKNKVIENPDEDIPNTYKKRMREFVQGISTYAKNINNDFIIIPQNGQEIITENGNVDDPVVTEYLNAIDGVGREDLFYGYNFDDVATPAADKNYMIGFLDICEQNGAEVLTTDYCWTHGKMNDSYTQNNLKSYISFAAPDRELNVIPDFPPTVYNENNDNITTLADAKNFLYLLNPGNYANKTDFINAIAATNYDVIIMDMFFEDQPFTVQEINSLKIKNNGGSRLVISYMSIGEAEDYRYYWNASWVTNPPQWLAAVNPDWPGNYKVRYWNQDWQNIIFGNDTSYSKKIIDAGFDGAYLDIIDAFEFFE